jgi:WD40 repeat protein
MTPPPAPASSSPKDNIHGLTEQIENYAEIPWPCPLTPSLTPLGGPLLRTLTGHSGIVKAVAVTPDGRRTVLASDDQTLKVWDLESGKLIAAFSAEGALHACAVAPGSGRPWDSVIVAGGASGRVHFLRLEGDESLKR